MRLCEKIVFIMYICIIKLKRCKDVTYFENTHLDLKMLPLVYKLEFLK
ncbi:hypothetical protein EZS27_002255 [termite gut metagenome]|uniref:Uncharacterized protein n=1 Tax=termite gut metagenome TaxID=433724 RepID=A0A5J4SYW9_9ZZZZ